MLIVSGRVNRVFSYLNRIKKFVSTRVRTRLFRYKKSNCVYSIVFRWVIFVLAKNTQTCVLSCQCGPCLCISCRVGSYKAKRRIATPRVCIYLWFCM